MAIQRKERRHGFYVKFCNLYLEFFKEKDESKDEDVNLARKYIVYAWKRYGRINYFGKGTMDRPFTHKNDMLSNTIDSHWKCEIIADHLTEKEACVLEAYLISICDRPLSKRGSYVWDGKSMINKQNEFTYKGEDLRDLSKKLLNIDNGNNYWEAIRRKANGY